MSESFHKILKEKRKEKIITQAGMAMKLGISLKQYQNYEYKQIPPLDKLKRLSEILGYDFTKLVYEQNVPSETSNQVGEPEAKYFTKTDLIEVIKDIKVTYDKHIIELIKKYVEDSSDKIAEKVKEKIMDNNKGDPRHSSHSKAG